MHISKTSDTVLPKQDTLQALRVKAYILRNRKEPAHLIAEPGTEVSLCLEQKVKWVISITVVMVINI